jgi:hypothetical protein
LIEGDVNRDGFSESRILTVGDSDREVSDLIL